MSRSTGGDLCLTVRRADGREKGWERDTMASRLSRTAPMASLAPPPQEAAWSLSESDFRELDYTHVGDFDSSWLAPNRVDWLEPLRPHVKMVEPSRADAWVGRNTFVHVHPDQLGPALPAISEALKAQHTDTRVSVLLSAESLEALGWKARLLAEGFRWVHSLTPSTASAVDWDGLEIPLPDVLHLYSIGERECRAKD